MNEDKFIRILEREMLPALGCTDPVGIAYAAARAREMTRGEIVGIEGELSVNIIKNAAAVSIPNTGGRCGVALAMALGAVAGAADMGLEVLSRVSEADVINALALIRDDRVKTSVSAGGKKLYIKITVRTAKDEAEVVIEDSYTKVVSAVCNGRAVPLGIAEEKNESAGALQVSGLSFKSIAAFADRVPIEKLGIIRQAVEKNMAIAEEGLKSDYGISVGRGIQKLIQEGTVPESAAVSAKMWAAAAADARMAGCPMPVISNSGSGNQGIASTVPVIAVARRLKADREKSYRAVCVSSLAAIYMKEKLGTLSPACGAVAAAIGSSSGIVYLLGGGAGQMVLAMKNIVATLSGILCDGAKAGCALKICACSDTAVTMAFLAMQNKSAGETDGIVGAGEKETVKNFARVSLDGMERADDIVLDIILNKKQDDGCESSRKPA
ncbi:MAG: serine dehydratase subunit alpha family protein [Oscillospiraceae bacterium]